MHNPSDLYVKSVLSTDTSATRHPLRHANKPWPITTILGSFALSLLLASCGGKTVKTGVDAAGSFKNIGDVDCVASRIDIEVVSGDRLQVSGFATWCRDEESASIGGINTGELAFLADLVNGKAEHVETVGGKRYIVTLDFTSGHLVVTEGFPDGRIGVHGVNVTFAGEYDRQ